MWTSSPHPRPGGASRTGRGWAEEGQQDWAPSSLGGRLWWPRTPYVPMAISPGPGASPLTPAAPSFLAPSPAELNPAGGWAWVCTAGDLRHRGEPGAGNSCVALEGLGVMGEKHGCRAGARTSGPALTPAWGGVIPTCLLCLMGRPSHNSGGHAGAVTSSGLLHRNRVTGGG